MIDNVKLKQFYTLIKGITEKLELCNVCERQVLTKINSKYQDSYQEEFLKLPSVVEEFIAFLKNVDQQLSALKYKIPKFIKVHEEVSSLLKLEDIQLENIVSKRIERLDFENQELLNNIKGTYLTYGRLKNIKREKLKNERFYSNQQFCQLCGQKSEDSKPNQLGPLLKIKQGPKEVIQLYAHELCALWTQEFYIFESEIFYGKFNPEGKRICSLCAFPKASLRCSNRKCKNQYHFFCFMNQQTGEVDIVDRTIQCSQHMKQIKIGDREDIFKLFSEQQIDSTRKKKCTKLTEYEVDNRMAILNEL